MRRAGRLGLIGAAAMLAAAPLAGCSRSVSVAVPAQGTSPACTALARAWPASVSGLEPVDTDPVSPAVRAYGDPAVIARCGVPEPGPSTDCLSVSGVDWVVSTLSDGARFVTFGRSPALEVLVPQGHTTPGNEGSLLPVFGPAAQTLPADGRRCS